MAQLRLGESEAGVASLERAIRVAPKFDRSYLNLEGLAIERSTRSRHPEEQVVQPPGQRGDGELP